MTKHAEQIWNGDGTTTDFYVGFDYLRRSHVIAEIDSTGTGSSYQLQTDPGEYEWEAQGLFVSFHTAPGKGALIRFTRETPRSPLTTFTDGKPATAEDLDAAHKQALYITQEVEDKVGT